MNDEIYPNFKQFLLLIILSFTALIFFGIIAVLFGSLLFDSYSEFSSIMNYFWPVASPVCTIPLIIYVSRKSGIPVKWTIKLPPIHFVLLLILLAISIRIITQPFNYPIEYFSNLIGGRFRFIGFVMPEFNLLLVIKFILVVFIGPIFEEIFWRKQIFGLLLKKYSPTVAIVLSSALFACWHLRIHDIGSLFIWGLLFCFVYYKTNSIELSILLHSIVNLSSFFVKRVFIDLKDIQFFKYIMILVINSIVIYLVLSYIGRQSSIKKDYEVDDPVDL